MYAIVRIGGRQYRAEVDETIVTEKLPYDEGETITLDDVLLLADGDEVSVGQPVVDGVSIEVEIVEQFRGKKIRVLKYKPKNRYRVRQGHRQHYTRLLVKSIATE